VPALFRFFQHILIGRDWALMVVMVRQRARRWWCLDIGMPNPVGGSEESPSGSLGLLGLQTARNSGYFFFLVVATGGVLVRRSASFTEINRPVFASRPIVVVVSFLAAML